MDYIDKLIETYKNQVNTLFTNRMCLREITNNKYYHLYGNIYTNQEIVIDEIQKLYATIFTYSSNFKANISRFVNVKDLENIIGEINEMNFLLETLFDVYIFNTYYIIKKECKSSLLERYANTLQAIQGSYSTVNIGNSSTQFHNTSYVYAPYKPVYNINVDFSIYPPNNYEYVDKILNENKYIIINSTYLDYNLDDDGPLKREHDKEQYIKDFNTLVAKIYKITSKHQCTS
jgi:hypothetical protein